MSDSSKKWRASFFIAVAFGVAAIGALGYGVMDQAVTISYISDGYSRTEQDLKTLAAAFPRDRYNKKDVASVLRRNDPKAFIVETPCTVQQNGIRFEFDPAGTMKNINPRAEYSPELECGAQPAVQGPTSPPSAEPRP